MVLGLHSYSYGVSQRTTTTTTSAYEKKYNYIKTPPVVFYSKMQKPGIFPRFPAPFYDPILTAMKKKNVGQWWKRDILLRAPR